MEVLDYTEHQNPELSQCFYSNLPYLHNHKKHMSSKRVSTRNNQLEPGKTPGQRTSDHRVPGGFFPSTPFLNYGTGYSNTEPPLCETWKPIGGDKILPQWWRKDNTPSARPVKSFDDVAWMKMGKTVQMNVNLLETLERELGRAAQQIQESPEVELGVLPTSRQLHELSESDTLESKSNQQDLNHMHPKLHSDIGTGNATSDSAVDVVTPRQVKGKERKRTSGSLSMLEQHLTVIYGLAQGTSRDTSIGVMGSHKDEDKEDNG